MKHILSAIILSCSLTSVAAQDNINIIPKPIEINQTAGTFKLTKQTVISCDQTLNSQAQYLQDILGSSTGWDLPIIGKSSKSGSIRLAISSAVRQKEGYRLTVTPQSVLIEAADEGGAFYGIQTLLQLFPAEVYSPYRQKNMDWTAPAVTISDAPSQPWRGMMLDVARYFYDKDFVKKYIDMMAMYKLNKLQFHLIDDSGWRLEIKKYPKLTEVGAWAGEVGTTSGIDQNRLGGYYTQEDIKEIIAYAKVRNVEVIPEIEFPAHMLSAVVAYPWLSCTEEQHEMPTQHFISRDILCVGKESSYQFLQDVLDETVDLFPSKYINIGGDEAVYDRWKTCPKCQKVMKDNGLSKVSDLQGYLTNRVLQMMKKKNRTVIGWDEIIQRGKLDEQVVALCWHTEKDTIRAVEKNHLAILTPATHTYFDFPESKTPGEIKAATWMPPVSVEKCYSLSVKDYVPGSHVLGVQGCYWSDQFIHGTTLQELYPLNENRSENYAEYLSFPRIIALAEVGWTKQNKRNFEDFSQRLSHHFTRLEQKGCHYRVPEPRIISMKESADGVTFTLDKSVDGSIIRYTTDGSYPTIHSKIYTSPVKVSNKNNFRAITVVNNHHYSLPIYFARDYKEFKEFGTFTTAWNPSVIKEKITPWRIDATGKISGNGTYEVTFIQTDGSKDLQIKDVRILKRHELLASLEEVKTVSKTTKPTYRFVIDSFEAGTPFYIDTHVLGIGGNDTNGAVFIKKISE